MPIPLEIALLKGFGPLFFGQTTEEAIALFGEPEEVQTLSDEILNSSTYVMHYWGRGFSLFFDLQANKTFNCVEVDNKEVMLFKQKVFILPEKELISLMDKNGYTLSETENQEWGEKRLSFDDAGLDCYYENGKLSSINFGVLNIGDDNFRYFPN